MVSDSDNLVLTKLARQIGFSSAKAGEVPSPPPSRDVHLFINVLDELKSDQAAAASLTTLRQNCKSLLGGILDMSEFLKQFETVCVSVYDDGHRGRVRLYRISCPTKVIGVWVGNCRPENLIESSEVDEITTALSV